MSEPNTMHQTLTDATNAVAVAGVTMPWWHELVGQVSAFAATWAPILSFAWLTVQFLGLAVRQYRKRRRG